MAVSIATQLVLGVVCGITWPVYRVSGRCATALHGDQDCHCIPRDDPTTNRKQLKSEHCRSKDGGSLRTYIRLQQTVLTVISSKKQIGEEVLDGLIGDLASSDRGKAGP